VGNLINDIKNKVKISDLLSTGYSKRIDCPCCKRIKSASVINNEFVYCYSASCNFKADVIALNALLTFGDKDRLKDSIKDLTTKFNIARRNSLSEEDKQKNLFYTSINSIYINDLKGPSLNYLVNRGLTKDVIDIIGIGYATGTSLRGEFSRSDLIKYGLFKNNKEFFIDRIIFPLMSNKIESFVGRYVGPENDFIPRYKNLQTSISTLILEQFIDLYNSNSIYIAEGFMDTISLYQLGMQSVGILGVQGLLNHISKLKKFNNICFCFDSDKDERGNYKSYNCLIPQIINLIILNPRNNYYVFLPDGAKDINELLCKGLLTKDLIESKKIRFNDFLVQLYIDDLSKHVELIKLIEVTNDEANREVMYNSVGKTNYQYATKILDFYDSKHY
jgi:DNA primase